MKILIVLLVGSAVANVWLLRASRQSGQTQVLPAAPRSPSSSRSEPAAAPPGVAGPAMSEDECQQRVRALEQTVALEKARQVAVLPARRLFDIGDPNPAAQTTMTRILDPIFAKLHMPRTHAVECRGSACRISVLEPAGAVPADANDWMAALQRDAELGGMRDGGLEFERVRWVRDEGSGSYFREIPTYVKLKAAPGGQL